MAGITARPPPFATGAIIVERSFMACWPSMTRPRSPARLPGTAGRNHGLLPNPSCTPGAIDPAVTQANIGSTICRAGYIDSVRRPPESQTEAAWMCHGWTSAGCPTMGRVRSPEIEAMPGSKSEVPGCPGRLGEPRHRCQLPVISASGCLDAWGGMSRPPSRDAGPAFLRGVFSWA